jgi:hypothetical protein
MNQRRSAFSNPSVLFSSPAQATQASGRINIERPVSTATQRIFCVLAATSLEAFPLRLLAHRLVAEQSPYIRFSAGSQGFIETIEGSETLKARARAIRDEIAQVVTVALSECAGQEPADPAAHLAAGLLLATWTVALIQAHRTFRHRRDTEEAKAAFLAIVDKGTIGLKAAMAGTPYA